MPRLASFYGIVICMYFKHKEHNPPHIHASYNDFAATIDFDGNVIDGSLPNTAKSLVVEWIKIHHDELLEMWKTQNIHKIEPLK